MSWIRLAQGVPTYSGRLRCPDAYDAWVGSHGELVAAAAARQGFSLFGRKRAARKAIWTELQAAAENGTLAPDLHATIAHFVSAAGELAAATPAFPHSFIEGRRLVVVPRVTCIARGFNAMTRELDSHPQVAGLLGGSALRDFFYNELVAAIDAALIQAAESMHHPMATGERWYVVGFDVSLSWLVPMMGGPERRGHFFVYEAPPRVAAKRWPFRALEASMRELQTSSATLSRVTRGEILRTARAMTDATPQACDSFAKVS